MIKIIWILTGVNTIALLSFIVWYLADASGRNVDTMEKGWTAILVIIGIVMILLAVIPLQFSHSAVAHYMAAFFAALPLVIGLGFLLSNKLPSFKRKQTMAELYYKDKTQRTIAAAIEQSDTLRLPELIKGQDLNIQGNRVWDWDGLNYLQFAIRLRKNATVFPFNDEANKAMIRLLVSKGAAVTPALPEATQCLPPDMVRLLLDAGADPNTHGFSNSDPLLFEMLSADKQQNAIAILLLQKGADKNAKALNNRGITPVMFAANNAQTSASWSNIWRVVRYLLEEAHCDYTFTTWDGLNLAGIIRKIRQDAADQKITMPPDFVAVVEWLRQHQVDTEPVTQLQ